MRSDSMRSSRAIPWSCSADMPTKRAFACRASQYTSVEVCAGHVVALPSDRATTPSRFHPTARLRRRAPVRVTSCAFRVGEHVEELHLGRACAYRNRRQAAVVRADAPVRYERRRKEVADERTDDVAVRDEKNALACAQRGEAFEPAPL